LAIQNAFALTPNETQDQRPLARASVGLLYGSTTAGSCNTTGCLFKMSTKGAATFLQCNDLALLEAPYSHNQLLKASDGTFYTALYDTDPQMQFVVGIIQHLAADGSVLFSIQMDRPTTGAEPDTRLTEGTDHNIYGVAPQGGPNNMGTVFRVTPSGTIAVLHSFSGTDGNRRRIARWCKLRMATSTEQPHRVEAPTWARYFGSRPVAY